MFDHFLNMFKLGKLNRNRYQQEKPKKVDFGKKKFLDFPADQFFFFTEIFLKKISGACPTRKNVHGFENNVGSCDLKNMIV